MIRWILLAVIGLSFGGGLYTMIARKGPPPDDALSQKAVRGVDPAETQQEAGMDSALTDVITQEREQLKRLQETIRLLRQDLEQRQKTKTTESKPDSSRQRAP